MNHDGFARREILRASLAAAAVSGFGPGRLARGETAAREWALTLRETAGLRRFGYPVSVVIPATEGPFRLERDGKVVPAQFRPVKSAGGAVLDFNASPGPLSGETYKVLAGPGVAAGPEPAKGMRVERLGDLFRVSNGGASHFDVPTNLSQMLSAVIAGKLAYVRNGEPGLSLAFHDDPRPHELVFDGAVSREGPLAVGLGFLSQLPRGGRSSVDLTFPGSKSWVELSWYVDDSGGDVSALEVGLTLDVEGDPLLFDFGANNTVYGTARAGEGMSLLAGEAPGLPPLGGVWSVQKHSRGGTGLFARSAELRPAAAEGWAHVVDERRCTAVAVEGFGRLARDEIRADQDGVLRLRRTFAARGARPAAGPKRLRIWLHFVPTPVQVGALTSPQAMLAPLDVSLTPVH